MTPVKGDCSICGEPYSFLASGPLLNPHVGACCWLQWSEPVWKTERLARELLVLAKQAQAEGKPKRARKLKNQLKCCIAILEDRGEHSI